jgi:hypothetical protein
MICPFDDIVLMYIILFMLSCQASRCFCNRFQLRLFLSLNFTAIGMLPFWLLHWCQENHPNGYELPSHTVCFPCYPEQGYLDKNMNKHRKISIVDEIEVCKD